MLPTAIPPSRLLGNPAPSPCVGPTAQRASGPGRYFCSHLCQPLNRHSPWPVKYLLEEETRGPSREHWRKLLPRVVLKSLSWRLPCGPRHVCFKGLLLPLTSPALLFPLPSHPLSAESSGPARPGGALGVAAGTTARLSPLGGQPSMSTRTQAHRPTPLRTPFPSLCVPAGHLHTPHALPFLTPPHFPPCLCFPLELRHSKEFI